MAAGRPVLQFWLSRWVWEQEAVTWPLCASTSQHHSSPLPFAGLAGERRPLDSLAKGRAARIIVRIMEWVWFCLEMG